MVKFISVTYGQTTELEVSVGSILLQTNPNWTLHVIHDGICPNSVSEIMERYAHDKRITFSCSDIRMGEWGHPNRDESLRTLIGNDDDLVILTNGDNYICPGLVDQVLTAQESRKNVGIVYFDCIHSHLNWGYHSSRLFEGGIDMAAAAIRYDIAKKVNFRWRHFSADGRYIYECSLEASKRDMCAVHIRKGLLIHN